MSFSMAIGTERMFFSNVCRHLLRQHASYQPHQLFLAVTPLTMEISRLSHLVFLYPNLLNRTICDTVICDFISMGMG